MPPPPPTPAFSLGLAAWKFSPVQIPPILIFALFPLLSGSGARSSASLHNAISALLVLFTPLLPQFILGPGSVFSSTFFLRVFFAGLPLFHRLTRVGGLSVHRLPVDVF